MNLPDSAITFLDAFRGIFSASNLSGMSVHEVYDTMPMIHCHCFTRETESDKAEVDIRQVGFISQFRSRARINATCSEGRRETGASSR